MQLIEFILFVADQDKSTTFYSSILQLVPSLYVPGMTEFELQPGVKLGLMPEVGIAKILGPNMVHPKQAQGVPRCELYLKVPNVTAYVERAVSVGAKVISPLQARNWGDTVVYLADMDGHIIALAEQ